MSACPEMERLLYDRVAGEVAPEAVPQLDAHLAACAACRAELSRIEDALDLAKLPLPIQTPSPGKGEGDRKGDLASSTLTQWNRRRRARVTVVALTAGALAAVAAGTLALAPALYAPGRRAAERTEGAPAWSPDVDGAWQASALLEVDAEEDATIEDAALAGLDAVER